MQVIDEALTPTQPISPNKFKSLVLDGIIGVSIAIFVFLLLGYFHNKVKTPEELENTLDTSLLGVIHFENEEERNKYRGNVTIIRNPKSQVLEAYRNTRKNIQFSNLDENLNVIAITSSKSSEGKSTIISNIGDAFGNLENKKVLIIDWDLRNPSVHRMFGLSNTEWLTDILIGNKTFKQYVQNTEVKNLKVLTTGNIPNNLAEILNSNRMRSFVEETKEHFDYVFIDTPPIGIVSDAGIVSTYSDGVILAAASNEVDDNVIKIAKERVVKVNANIIGCILFKWIPLIVIIYVVLFEFFKRYKSLWSFAGLDEVMKGFAACVIGCLINVIIMLFLNPRIPMMVTLSAGILTMVFTLWFRLSFRMYRRLVIYGTLKGIESQKMF